MTKAGGVGPTEAIQLKVPLVLQSAVPANERDNFRYYTETGVGIDGAGEEIQTAMAMLDNSAQLATIQRAQARFRDDYTTKDIVDFATTPRKGHGPGGRPELE